jgi:hypothetical protein
MVEHWFPKPKVDGSSPSFPDKRANNMKRVCSLMVKYTAHNGNDVGSTPIRLKLFSRKHTVIYIYEFY